MELEEIKALWTQSNRELEASMRLNSVLLRQSNLRTADTSTRRFTRGIWLELIVNAVGLVLLGSFAGDHFRQPQFFIPAAVLGVYGIALLNDGVRQLIAAHALDFDEPVIVIQKKLEQLRIRRIRTILWTLLLGPLMWVPLLVVTLRGLFGVNLYAALSPEWLVANALFGLAVIPSAIFLARRYGSLLAVYTPMRRLADEIAGRSLSRAFDSLDALRRFEAEP
jgi:hypothetical protein